MVLAALAVLPSVSPSNAAPGPTPLVTTAAPAAAMRLIQYAPVADTTAEQGLTSPLGASFLLTADASRRRIAYLRFDTSALRGTVSSAILRLHVADDPTGSAGSASVSGGSIAAMANHTWSEATMTDADRPPVGSLRLDTLGAVTSGSWVQFDVTRAMRVGGPLDLAITTDNADAVRYNSRESGPTAPQLIVSVGRARPATGGVVLAAVGDMACAPTEAVAATACRQRAVSDLIVHDPQVSAFLALGDVQYPTGAPADYVAYDRSYGRLNDMVIPVLGNHEYLTPDAAGWFGYFRPAVGSRLALGTAATGYYSVDIGTNWHVVVLNSNCTIVSCAAGQPQETWLRADLAASTRPCTIVAFHHPRFASSAVHPSDRSVDALWLAAQQAGVELVITGHDHQYERFAPQRSDATPSPTAPREFVVGTGGVGLYAFAAPAPNSEVRIASTFGYLRLTLRTDGYGWQFIDEQHLVRDSGSGSCHGA